MKPSLSPAQSDAARSADGVPIHYDVFGHGPIALIFVHGWCCNRHFWANQVEHFQRTFTVVALDLGGHGDSGQERSRWTPAAFGQDVVAVVSQLGLSRTVLIGHSLGGPVIIEAARQLPQSVVGLVGVETFNRLRSDWISRSL